MQIDVWLCKASKCDTISRQFKGLHTMYMVTYCMYICMFYMCMRAERHLTEPQVHIYAKLPSLLLPDLWLHRVLRRSGQRESVPQIGRDPYGPAGYLIRLSFLSGPLLYGHPKQRGHGVTWAVMRDGSSGYMPGSIYVCMHTWIAPSRNLF